MDRQKGNQCRGRSHYADNQNSLSPLHFLVIGIVTTAATLISFLTVHFSGPEGFYDASCFADEGFDYWEFKDGNVWRMAPVIPERRTKEGRYYKKDNRWVYQARTVENGFLYLESSLGGFWLVDSNVNTVMKPSKRLFIRPAVVKLDKELRE